MSSPVELYVYDLSNGMARQLSAQLTGRQIDGIWYTLLSFYHYTHRLTVPCIGTLQSSYSGKKSSMVME